MAVIFNITAPCVCCGAGSHVTGSDEVVKVGCCTGRLYSPTFFMSWRVSVQCLDLTPPVVFVPQSVAVTLQEEFTTVNGESVSTGCWDGGGSIPVTGTGSAFCDTKYLVLYHLRICDVCLLVGDRHVPRLEWDLTVATIIPPGGGFDQDRGVAQLLASCDPLYINLSAGTEESFFDIIVTE